eukprot:3338093-Ditylum_brightwellii.AAC.1
MGSSASYKSKDYDTIPKREKHIDDSRALNENKSSSSRSSRNEDILQEKVFRLERKLKDSTVERDVLSETVATLTRKNDRYKAQLSSKENKREVEEMEKQLKESTKEKKALRDKVFVLNRKIDEYKAQQGVNDKHMDKHIQDHCEKLRELESEYHERI